MSDVGISEIFEADRVEAIGAARTSAHTSASKDCVEVITRGARRRWSRSVKRAVVEASLAPGVMVSALCRQHEISSGQLSTWRRQYRDGDLAEAAPLVPGFARAVVSGTAPALGLAAPTAMETIEIALPDGVVLRVGAGVSHAALSRVLAALRDA
ncbi:IS66-like element accessory protein TnpA [Acidiphilium multivorum]|uniref:IS66-like element accessory protein TnpA n=1 Tax=Acidiphilium multivorum TaxID=62140 RepID=UPI0039C95D5C